MRMKSTPPRVAPPEPSKLGAKDPHITTNTLDVKKNSRRSLDLRVSGEPHFFAIPHVAFRFQTLHKAAGSFSTRGYV